MHHLLQPGSSCEVCRVHQSLACTRCRQLQIHQAVVEIFARPLQLSEARSAHDLEIVMPRAISEEKCMSPDLQAPIVGTSAR